MIKKHSKNSISLLSNNETSNVSGGINATLASLGAAAILAGAALSTAGFISLSTAWKTMNRLASLGTARSGGPSYSTQFLDGTHSYDLDPKIRRFKSQFYFLVATGTIVILSGVASFFASLNDN